MIHYELLKTIKKDKQKSDLIYPYYGKYSISEIPTTILSLFGFHTDRKTLPFMIHKTGDFQKVVFFFIDGFGFDQFSNHKEQSFLAKLAKKGEVYPITSVFPSTTAAATAGFHSVLTPQEHGLPEWTVYFKELGQIIRTLPFQSIGSEEPDEMLKKGGNIEMLFNTETIYEKLKSVNVKSFVFINQKYSKSAYTQASQKGAETVAFSDGADLVGKLRNHIENYEGYAYYLIYWEKIDEMEHKYGIDTAEYKKAVNYFFELLQQEFLEKLNLDKLKNTLLLLSADHGQISVNPKDTIYLDKIPGLVSNLAKDKSGKPIGATGSARDVFLHVEEAKLEETINLLKNKLRGKAEVFEVSEAIQLGLFGLNAPIQKFIDRIGNVLILPSKNNTIWYEHIPGKLFVYFGMHGGLSEQEMIVPFAYAKLSDLT